ncbi:MAG: SDR family NAD(P)-dependent oxidoreductase [Rhodospirillaceae bacterium]|nr:SDR family NAD(P)-dependent oxidoreductase [Rhodospirillaceae bacterium]
MDQLLGGKPVIVTGGAQGIGRAIAEAVVREGGQVVIADLPETRALVPPSLLDERGDRVEFVPCDVRCAADVSATVDRAVSRFSALHGLVNNAGVGITGPTLELSELQFDRTVDINLKGVFLFLQQAAKRMMIQGSEGSIVNIASVGGVVGTPEFLLYSMSKHGVIGMTRSAALEFANRGIRVNAVCPGPVWTSMLQAAAERTYGTDDPREVARRQRIPRGELGRPEDVAEMVVWLLSDRAANCTGSAFMNDGGYTAQ